MLSKEKFNLIFKNLDSFIWGESRLPEGIKMVESKVIKKVSGDHSEQGEEGEENKLFDIGEDYKLLVVINTDSYGDNERIGGMKLVNAIEKQITTYEYE